MPQHWEHEVGTEGSTQEICHVPDGLDLVIFVAREPGSYDVAVRKCWSETKNVHFLLIVFMVIYICF